MVGIGRDLCGSSSPTLLPKQGYLQQAIEDLVQAGLEYLQRRRLHSLPGQPVPVQSMDCTNERWTTSEPASAVMEKNWDAAVQLPRTLGSAA